MKAFAILVYSDFLLRMLWVITFSLETSSSWASIPLWSSYWSLSVNLSNPSSFPFNNLFCSSIMIAFSTFSPAFSFSDRYLLSSYFFSISVFDSFSFNSTTYLFISWKWLTSPEFLMEIRGSFCPKLLITFSSKSFSSLSSHCDPYMMSLVSIMINLLFIMLHSSCSFSDFITARFIFSSISNISRDRDSYSLILSRILAS